MESIIIFGAGNVGRKALEVLNRQRLYFCKGFIDDKVEEGSLVQGIPVLGSSNKLNILYKQGIKKVFVAMGNNHLRRKVGDLLEKDGFEIVSLIDPSSFVSCEASIGKGVLIMPYVYVGHNAKLGDFVICQTSSIVGHYSIIGESANLSYGCIVSAYANVGNYSRISIGAKVLNKINVGESTLIGAGSVVTKSIPSRVIAYGVPAKVIRKFDIANYDPNAIRGDE